MSEHVLVYLRCLDQYPGLYVNEQRALEYIDLWLDREKLKELFPVDSRVGKLIRTIDK